MHYRSSVALSSSNEWIISTFGEPWCFRLAASSGAGVQAGPARVDWIGHDDPIGALLYSGFDDSGALRDEIAVPLLEIYDALTGSDVIGRLDDPHRPTADPRGLLRGFERELGDAVYDAVQLGLLSVVRFVAARCSLLRGV